MERLEFTKTNIVFDFNEVKKIRFFGLFEVSLDCLRLVQQSIFWPIEDASPVMLNLAAVRALTLILCSGQNWPVFMCEKGSLLDEMISYMTECKCEGVQ